MSDFETLINSAISYINNDKIMIDEDKAAAISNKLGKISSEIEMASAQLEGPIAEAQPVWTGEAAESFFSEASKLISETKEISAKVKQNRQSFNTAVSILMNADSDVNKDINNLSTGNIFNN